MASGADGDADADGDGDDGDDEGAMAVDTGVDNGAAEATVLPGATGAAPASPRSGNSAIASLLSSWLPIPYESPPTY